MAKNKVGEAGDVNRARLHLTFVAIIRVWVLISRGTENQ
jgi:hypothetical protein